MIETRPQPCAQGGVTRAEAHEQGRPGPRQGHGPAGLHLVGVVFLLQFTTN